MKSTSRKIIQRISRVQVSVHLFLFDSPNKSTKIKTQSQEAKFSISFLCVFTRPSNHYFLQGVNPQSPFFQNEDNLWPALSRFYFDSPEKNLFSSLFFLARQKFYTNNNNLLHISHSYFPSSSRRKENLIFILRKRKQNLNHDRMIYDLPSSNFLFPW